jgi:ABC-type Zn uptake system ZnuABC Zn-binding protein ZnuA
MAVLTACSSTTEGGEEGTKVQIVATTTLVGDVVRVVGGDLIDLTVMLPTGGDPHGFNPTPQDVTRAAQADVLFINGLDLEEFMAEMLENAAADMNIVELSAHIEATPLDEDHDEEHADEEHGKFDPHVWWNPLHVATWADVVAEELARLNPENGAVYEANAAAYRQELVALDEWIKEQVAQIPAENRILVTDHDSLGYFVDTYGFELVGTVFPGLSTQAEPSAQDLAELTTTIRAYGVPAVFVGTTVSQSLANQVAQETGTNIIPIYTDSLSEEDGPANTYLTFMRANVETIVGALK